MLSELQWEKAFKLVLLVYFEPGLLLYLVLPVANQ